MKSSEIDEMIERQTRIIKESLAIHGSASKVGIYQESGFYTLMINRKTILSSPGKENFSYALGGFIRGMHFAWEL